MSKEDVLKIYGSHLNPYEKDEIQNFEMVYYLSFSKRR